MRGDRVESGERGIEPYDAWVLARVVSAQPVDGATISRMTATWRRVAERLLGSSVGGRAMLLGGFLLVIEAPGPIGQAVDLADPMGPAPAVGPGRDEDDDEADDDEADGPAVEAILCRASDVTEERVEWLWRDRVPLGMLTLFSGDPKVGKSLTTISMIARLTTGRPMPGCDEPTTPGSALLLSAEDSAAMTLKPRLLAVGADVSKVVFFSGVRERVRVGAEGQAGAGAVEVHERMPTLDTFDIALLEEAVAGLGDCRLIVIDPVSAYLGGCDDHRNSELRGGVLTPLQKMAERTGVAIVLVTHHNKSAASPSNGKHRVSGSIAYVAACRANFLFLRDPEDESGRRALMLDNGGNLAPRQPGLAYVVADDDGRAYCDWQPGTIDLDADAALALAARAARKEKEKDKETSEGGPRVNRLIARCCDWLRAYLADGDRPVAECESAAKEAGFTCATLYRARSELGVESRRVMRSGRQTNLLSLPGDYEIFEIDFDEPEPVSMVLA